MPATLNEAKPHLALRIVAVQAVFGPVPGGTVGDAVAIVARQQAFECQTD